MASEQRILDLMVKWDEARERGVDLRPEDLSNHPAEQAELRLRFASIEAAEILGAKAPRAGDRPIAAPKIEGYDVREMLGRGGMGVVWRAQEPGAGNRTVAIKVFTAGPTAGPLDRRRFSQELDAISLLKHPNIVEVLTYGSHRGQPYLVLEYIEGGNLANWHAAQAAAGSREHQRRVAGLIAAAARAVDHAHSRGVTHRDLKPENILLRPDGTPVISDFGLAKIDPGIAPPLGTRDRLTETGAVLGTPAYMAPEQARGDKVLTTRVDIWGLGVVLYELLTGKLPFPGGNVFAQMNRIIETDPPSPRGVEPRVARDVEVICLKCLEKEADKRYRTAAELADDLECWLVGRPIRARVASLPERTIKWARRRPAVASLCAALVIVSSAGAGVAGWHYDENRRIAGDLSKTVGELSTTVNHLEKERDTVKSLYGELQRKLNRDALLGRTVVYADSLGTAKRLWDEGCAGAAREYLNACPWNLRGWEHALLRRQFDETSLTLRGHAGEVTSVQFSPDGRRLASASLDRTLRLWDTNDFRQVLRLEAPWPEEWGGFGSVCFSPDGRLVAGGSRAAYRVADAGKVVLWNATSGQQLLELAAPHGCVRELCFSPDGSRLAGAISSADETDGAVVIWDAETGARLLALRGDGRGFLAVRFSPDGQKLAAADIDSDVTVWDARGSKQYTIHGGGRFVCFSPDGRRIATAGGLRNGKQDSDVGVADASSGVGLLTIKGHVGGLTSLAYGPDGAHLCGGGAGGAIRVWDAWTGDVVHSLTGHERDVGSVCFSANGMHLASATWDYMNEAAEIRIWDIDTGHGPLTIRTRSSLLGGCVSPDGGRVACVSDQTVRVMDAQSGREIFAIKGPSRSAGSVCFVTVHALAGMSDGEAAPILAA